MTGLMTLPTSSTATYFRIFVNPVSVSISISQKKGLADLVTSKRFEERLEAAEHGAAQDSTLDLHLADAQGPLDLSRRRRADEGHLDPLRGWLLNHLLTE